MVGQEQQVGHTRSYIGGARTLEENLADAGAYIRTEPGIARLLGEVHGAVGVERLEEKVDLRSLAYSIDSLDTDKEAFVHSRSLTGQLRPVDWKVSGFVAGVN